MNKRKKTLTIMLCIFGFFILPISVFCESQDEKQDIERLLTKSKEEYKIQKKTLEQKGFNVTVEEDSYSEVGKEKETEKIIKEVSFSSGKWKVLDLSTKDSSKTEEPFFILELIDDLMDNLYNVLQDRNYTIKYQQEDLLGTYSCHLLYFEPKKKKRDTIKGQVWIEKESARIVKAAIASAKLPCFVKKGEHNLSFFNINGFWVPQSFIEETKLSIPFVKKLSHQGVYQFYDWRIETGKENAF